MFRDGLAYMMRALRPAWRLRFAADADEALRSVEEVRPDVAIIDVGLPGEDGFALLGRLAARLPDLPQILISGRNDIAVRVRARTCGARGFLAKTMAPERIAEIIDRVLAGGTGFEDTVGAEGAPPALTARQAQVLDLLAEGHGNKEIRHRLGIAERTVRAHLTELFQLLGAHSRTHAIIRARSMGLID